MEREPPFGHRRSQRYKLLLRVGEDELHDLLLMLVRTLGYRVCVMLAHGLRVLGAL